MFHAPYPSKYLQACADELAKLPGIGRKTALRLALHLLQQPAGIASSLGQSIIAMRERVVPCVRCGNIADGTLCSVCLDTRRDQGLVCVVETVRDVMAIEATQQYRGVYHVLGGVLSPMAGIGPGQLTIAALASRTESEQLKEIILALGATMEGDTTAFYLYRQLQGKGLRITALAKGIAIGHELEYTDEATLARSLASRTDYVPS